MKTNEKHLKIKITKKCSLSILWTVENYSLVHIRTTQSLQNQFIKVVPVAADGIGYIPSHLPQWL